jgi:uncharacterized protein (TIGR00369 family)
VSTGRDDGPWEELRPGGPHIWRTLGYRRTATEPGRVEIEWDAAEEYTFPDGGGSIVHGGLVATVLDTAMGAACATTLEDGESFLTADLRVEFMRAARPGLLRADGRVVQRTRRVAFCTADLYDAEGSHLASARCTQVVRLASRGHAKGLGE